MNYRLTNNSLEFNGETLYQIECVEDCKWIKKGELGGYIASYENLEDGGWVAIDAFVCDTSIVSGYIGRGCVAGNSVVEGKVKGTVIKNSFVDKDCDLENVFILNSCIYDSKYESFKKENFPLTRLLVVYSCISEVEMFGAVEIFRSSINKSKVAWQIISDKKIEEGYWVENFEIPETYETGEVGTKRVSDEVVTKMNEEKKKMYEEYEFEEFKFEGACRKGYDSCEDILFEKLDIDMYRWVLRELNSLKTEKTQINSFQIRELNRMGYRLI